MRGSNVKSSADLAHNALGLARQVLDLGNEEEGERLLGDALAHLVDACNFARKARKEQASEDHEPCSDHECNVCPGGRLRRFWSARLGRWAIRL